jgi:hypothetical protein
MHALGQQRHRRDPPAGDRPGERRPQVSSTAGWWPVHVPPGSSTRALAHTHHPQRAAHTAPPRAEQRGPRGRLAPHERDRARCLFDDSTEVASPHGAVSTQHNA